jgi:hypothetical protein
MFCPSFLGVLGWPREARTSSLLGLWGRRKQVCRGCFTPLEWDPPQGLKAGEWGISMLCPLIQGESRRLRVWERKGEEQAW